MTDLPSAMRKKSSGDNPAIAKRVRRHIAGRIREYFTITPPGFEETCCKELVGLGIDGSNMATVSGGVTFAGRFVDCQRANLYLRTATRILMRVDTFSATNVRQLEKKSGQIPWELFLPAGMMPEIKVRSRRSRLYHTDVISRGLHNGLAQRFGELPGSTVPCGSQTLFVRVVEDRYTLSLDSSGEPLYKRGLKSGPARAPLREAQAAAILMAAGYDPGRPLVDPMCGSGTFSLEAAMAAKQMAPGAKRSFAFMKWPVFRESQWAFLKREAKSRLLSLGRPMIFASDLDAGACKRLAATVDGHGLSDAVSVVQKDVFECRADQYDGGPGLITINPPYGIRIGLARQADDLFKDICLHLVHRFKGWTVALIAPRQALANRLPFPARRLPLLHGGLRLTLILGTIR